jgi:hypothetical protein
MNYWYEYVIAFAIGLAGCLIVGLLLDAIYPLS